MQLEIPKLQHRAGRIKSSELSFDKALPIKLGALRNGTLGESQNHERVSLAGPGWRVGTAAKEPSPPRPLSTCHAGKRARLTDCSLATLWLVKDTWLATINSHHCPNWPYRHPAFPTRTINNFNLNLSDCCCVAVRTPLGLLYREPMVCQKVVHLLHVADRNQGRIYHYG